MTDDPVQWVGLALVLASVVSLMWFMLGWVMGLMWASRHPEEESTELDSIRTTNEKIRDIIQGDDD